LPPMPRVRCRKRKAATSAPRIAGTTRTFARTSFSSQKAKWFIAQAPPNAAARVRIVRIGPAWRSISRTTRETTTAIPISTPIIAAMRLPPVADRTLHRPVRRQALASLRREPDRVDNPGGGTDDWNREARGASYDRSLRKSADPGGELKPARGHSVVRKSAAFHRNARDRGDSLARRMAAMATGSESVVT